MNDNEYKKQSEYAKFLVRIKGDEIVVYNDIVRFLEDSSTNPSEQFWNLKDIVGHKGPLSHDHKS